jgi:hypothetical protein
MDLNKIWYLCDKYNLSIETESIAINMITKYDNVNNNYKDELCYVSLLLSTKLYDEYFISLPKIVYKFNDKSLYQLEIDLANLNYFKRHYFLNTLTQYLTLFKSRKTLGPDFVNLIRFLTWHDIKANFHTIILAVKILKQYNQYKINQIIKYHQLYQLFLKVSKFYNLDIKNIINEYKKLIKI